MVHTTGPIPRLILLGFSILGLAASLVTGAVERMPTSQSAPRWSTRTLKMPGLEYRQFESAAAGTTVSYHVFVPRAYSQDPAKHFPVVYWLHGYGGGLGSIPPIASRFDYAIETGVIPPALVVFPSGFNSLWVDSKNGDVPMETMLVKELIPDVDAYYRTIHSGTGRLIEGFSMGGYGTARLGFKYPQLFGAVSILSGGPLQQEFLSAPRAGERKRQHVLDTVFGGEHAYFRAQSPWMLAEEHAVSLRDQSSIRMVIGADDEMLEVNRQFHNHLQELQIQHTYTEVPGVGHKLAPLLSALGQEYWGFIRTFLEGATHRHD